VNNKTNLKITLLGTSLLVRSDKDLNHLHTVVQYFEKKLEEIKKRLPNAEPLKLSIIAALNIIDELLAIQASSSQQRSETLIKDEALEMEKIAQKMIQKLDTVLESKISPTP
jgi:cell division protein ZapA